MLTSTGTHIFGSITDSGEFVFNGVTDEGITLADTNTIVGFGSGTISGSAEIEFSRVLIVIGTGNGIISGTGYTGTQAQTRHPSEFAFATVPEIEVNHVSDAADTIQHIHRERYKYILTKPVTLYAWARNEEVVSGRKQAETVLLVQL